MRLLGGSAARQHLIILLAGRHLSSDLFNWLASEVESLFFCYVITREPTRNFERDFARWATELRSISSKEEMETFINRRFLNEKIKLSVRFDDAMGRLYYGTLQQYGLRYVLAKLTQYVELAAYGETEGTSWLQSYTSGGFEIEHILPQKPDAKAAEEFGPIEDPLVSQRLGNLVLVEKSINSSLGNRAYSEKRPIYLQSKLLLTRSLSERPQVGTNTRIDRAVASIESFPTWTERDVLQRQQWLADLARSVWRMPASSAAPS